MQNSSRGYTKLEIKLETPLGCDYANAIMPDDVDLPVGLDIRYTCIDEKLTIYLSYSLESLGDLLTLKNTLDEVIRALQIIEKTIPL
ncbi:MAG: KEOPS complex subunit Pcc1 [Pyrobaculum sp.]|jgi:hypothetical protein